MDLQQQETQSTAVAPEDSLIHEPALDSSGNFKVFVWPRREGRCTSLSLHQLKLAATQECASFQYGNVIVKFREGKELGLTLTASIVLKERSEYDNLMRKRSLPVCGEAWDVEPYSTQNLTEAEWKEKFGSKMEERKKKAYLIKVPSGHSLSSIKRYCDDTKSGGLEYVKGIFRADQKDAKFSIGFEDEVAAVDFVGREHKFLGPFVQIGKYKAHYKAGKDPRVAERSSS
ncbi:hypothetical protein BV898_16832 [Hypsibius exemplaris]|uniref:Uncharacterized protein n=1 Tax=Hypsibius exemplaris TaxID=2072580 RepID=A0A9X6NDW7_HYPEX|nr:hypothetical protein BV898_16832 [Hypsibius exemplaris]